jgi:hypothetical protein
LILALAQCDTDDKSEREAGLKAVCAVMDEYETNWKKLQKVYARRRFIAYPENYVQDRYFHIGSKREDMSFITLDHQPYILKVKKWLKEQNH